MKCVYFGWLVGFDYLFIVGEFEVLGIVCMVVVFKGV